MNDEREHKKDDFYEAYFPGIGIIRWQGPLPEWVDTERGLIHRNILKKMAGTRLWEWTSTGWVLSNRHA